MNHNFESSESDTLFPIEDDWVVVSLLDHEHNISPYLATIFRHRDYEQRGADCIEWDYGVGDNSEFSNVLWRGQVDDDLGEGAFDKLVRVLKSQGTDSGEGGFQDIPEQLMRRYNLYIDREFARVHASVDINRVQAEGLFIDTRHELQDEGILPLGGLKTGLLKQIIRKFLPSG